MDNRLRDLTQQFILPLWTQKDFSVIDRFVCVTAQVQTSTLHGIGRKALKSSLDAIFEKLLSLDFHIETLIQREHQYIYQWSGKGIYIETEEEFSIDKESSDFSGIISVEVQDDLVVRYNSYCNIQSSSKATQTLFKKITPALSDDDMEFIIATIRKITGRRLTKREVECLNLWLKGFSIKETARFLGGLSGRTIQTFRENIKRKMNVETYRQLFIFAQKSGIISMLLD